MRTNPILTEIRQTRDDLARESGNDVKRFFDYVRERERDAALHGVKFVSPAPRENETAAALHDKPAPKQE